MLKVWSEFNWKQGAPRVAADLVTVQLAALLALVGAVLIGSGSPGLNMEQAITALRQYYIASFLPLSTVFPAVFLLHGFYTRNRSYSTHYKWRVVVQGATVATLVFLFANFLLTRADTLPRSAALLFAVFVNAGTLGSRLLKAWLITPASPAPIQSAGLDGPVLVVGGGGYIGSILCRKLLAAGQRVRLLESFVYGNDAVRDLIGLPGFELVVGDCRNIQSVVSAVHGASSIVHLAAIVGDPACDQDRKAALEINYAATRMMIEVAKGYGVERFIFASSCSVYGETEELVDERSALNPISLYAQTKLDSERALLGAATSKFHPTVFRLATVFGHSFRPRFDLVVNLLTAKAINDGTITIFNGEQWRPFIHVADVADGIMQLLAAPLSVVSGETFNLGDSRMNFRLSEVALAIQRLIPKVRIERVENPDRRNYRVCFDKVRDQIGFRCRTSLEEGIREMKDAILQKTVVDYRDPRYHNQRFLQSAGRLIPKEEIDTQVMAAFAVALENHQKVVVPNLG